jgi:hypothetical protein
MGADDERDRKLAEAEILVKIADIEKATVSAQAAALRSETNRLEDLLRREAQAHEHLRHDLEVAESALNALRLEHEAAIGRLASVAAKQIGRAFIAAAFEGIWPLRRWLQHHRARQLRQSGLVDPAWYLARNPDVAEAGMDPVLHYLHHGAEEGRAPNPALHDPPED